LKIDLSEIERQQLERWRRAGKTEKRMLTRIEIIELAAQGLSSRQIAIRLKRRRPTVLKWRRRFCQQRLEGLRDAPRSGPRRRYTAASAPESALGRRGESPLQVNVTCNRLQLRRRETGWGAAEGERSVRRMTNSIRPVRGGEPASEWRSPEIL